LRQLGVSPETQAARMVLDPTWTVRGIAFRASAAAEPPGPSPVAVWEVLPGGGTSSGGATPAAVRRYLIDSKTHLLVRFEEWQPDGASRRPRRGSENGGGGLRYRREDYSGVRAGAGPLPAALTSQTLPPGYAEAALPSTAGAGGRRPLRRPVPCRPIRPPVACSLAGPPRRSG
jgi:hypothetical protein